MCLFLLLIKFKSFSFLVDPVTVVKILYITTFYVFMYLHCNELLKYI